MNSLSRIFVLILLSILIGCAHAPKEEVGMVIGGVLGGVLGHQVGGGRGQAVSTVLGAIVGGAVGASIGRSMDELDRLRMSAALEVTRTGVASVWQNPDTGYEYRMTPTDTYRAAYGPCREYVLEASIGGDTEQIYGTACRQPDGSWKIVE
jgi:surface antigen